MHVRLSLVMLLCVLFSAQVLKIAIYASALLHDARCAPFSLRRLTCAAFMTEANTLAPNSLAPDHK